MKKSFLSTVVIKHQDRERNIGGAFIKRAVLAMLIMTNTTIVYAGDAENIMACVKKANEFSGVNLSEFEASYQGNILSLSTARWGNAYCEVKLSDVYNLQVNGTQFIFNRFAGRESYDLNNALAVKTGAAINQLKSRIALLEQRMSQVSVSLKMPKPNHAWLTRYIDEGIEKSIGAQHQESAPTKATQVIQSPPAPLAVQPPKIADTYYVNESVLEERLAPSDTGSVTNRIYRRQKVNVFEIKNGWARVSNYYDGAVEGNSGQVARWILASGLSSSQPVEPSQPSLHDDSRIAKDAFSGLSGQDIKILYKGAVKFLNSGKCAHVDEGDASANRPGAYYIRCDSSYNKIYFTPDDVQ